ncbi:MAG: DUF1569 domain-containing protein [Bacteroidota bacterium]|jgi:hypothetical protein
MTILNIFDPETTKSLTERINKLTAKTTPLWGKMNVGQMLAHCSIAYEQAYDPNTKRPPLPVRFLLKLFLKGKLTDTTTPYQKNSGTAPAFIIKDTRDFEKEKTIILEYIQRTEKLGAAYFANKESTSFGKMTADEWNNLFYKHLDHHLTQFGV